MSGFENTMRRPASATPTGPTAITVPPPPGGADPAESGQRKRPRSAGVRSIAVCGVGGGTGATTVAALLWTLAAERSGGRTAAGDRVGGELLDRLPGRPVDGGMLLVHDVGPHASDVDGATEAVSRAGDVVVVVAALDRDGVTRGRAAHRAIAARREDAGSVRLVFVETRPGGSRRLRATAAAGALLLPWDEALSARRRIEPDRLAEGTRTALAPLLAALLP